MQNLVHTKSALSKWHIFCQIKVDSTKIAYMLHVHSCVNALTWFVCVCVCVCVCLCLTFHSSTILSLPHVTNPLSVPMNSIDCVEWNGEREGEGGKKRDLSITCTTSVSTHSNFLCVGSTFHAINYILYRPRLAVQLTYK